MTRERVPLEKRNVSKVRRECLVSGCGLPHRSLGLCEKHYYRQRRTGSTANREVLPYLKTNGYLALHCPDHPLRRGKRCGIEYLHRIVFYDAHGSGPFLCHVCGSTVTWDTLHVDHLNDVRADNRVGNLAAACGPCNQRRGRHKMVETMRAKHSTLVTFRGETLPLIDWAKRIGVSRESLRARLAKWPLERAMTEPRGPAGPKAPR